MKKKPRHKNKRKKKTLLSSLSPSQNFPSSKRSPSPPLLFSTPFFSFSFSFFRRRKSSDGARSARSRSGAARGASGRPERSTSWRRSGSCYYFFKFFECFFVVLKGSVSVCLCAFFPPCSPWHCLWMLREQSPEERPKKRGRTRTRERKEKQKKKSPKINLKKTKKKNPKKNPKKV